MADAGEEEAGWEVGGHNSGGIESREGRLGDKEFLSFDDYWPQSHTWKDADDDSSRYANR